MITDGRFNDLEQRVRTVESEIEGNRHVTLYMAEQAQRNGEVFLALRSDVAAFRAEVGAVSARVDHITNILAVAQQTLVRHGRALDILIQDVGLLRNEMTAMRHDMATWRQETQEGMGALRQEMATWRQETQEGMAGLRQEMATQHDMAGVREEMGALRQEMATQHDMAGLRQEMAMMREEVITAIRALADGGRPHA